MTDPRNGDIVYFTSTSDQILVKTQALGVVWTSNNPLAELKILKRFYEEGRPGLEAFKRLLLSLGMSEQYFDKVMEFVNGK